MNLHTLDRLLKLRFSLFDAPVAMAGALLSYADKTWGVHIGWGNYGKWLTTILAVLLARAAGMAFNEYIDRQFDAANPRTAQRAIPLGLATPSGVLFLAWSCALLFILTCFFIGVMIGVVSPILIAMIFAYSYLKRVTLFCHFFLGLVIALGPVMAALVTCGGVPMSVMWLALGLLMSIAANDILYATQDRHFDREHRLRSIPAHFGMTRALLIARMLHAGTFGAFWMLGMRASLSPLYWLGLLGIGGYLFVHHLQIREGGSVYRAFIRCNKVVALGIFFSVLGGLVWHELS